MIKNRMGEGGRCISGAPIHIILLLTEDKQLRHIFIINPAAGAENSQRGIEKNISALSEDSGNIDIYYTARPGDATEYVRSVCSSDSGELRFYACGGDGTLNEVVNGAAGFDHAAVGCCPCGSGNDFVKYFGGAEPFLDLDAQINGVEMEVDLIRANGEYFINTCNFGLESAVVKYMGEVKNKPLFSGKNAYFAGVAKAFVKDMRTKCRISVDGELVADGDILLFNLSNGSNAGSAFRCAPRAEMDNGKIEFCMFRPVPRLKFLRLAPGYAMGTHLDDPQFAPYLCYRRCSKVEVSSDEELAYVVDGELRRTKSFTAEAVHRAMKIIVPKGLEGCLKNQEETEKAVNI